jgi:hypothetical protein
MPDSIESFLSPGWTFLAGFGLCAIFLVMSLFSHWKTKREFRRFKGHLTDKLELDARNLHDTKDKLERLAHENENLRLQIGRLNEKPEHKLNRELEVLARAEKHMMINAPGFAPAWELAKSQALAQIETEEQGKSFPQRIFRKLLGHGSPTGSAVIAETSTAATEKSNSTAPSDTASHS